MRKHIKLPRNFYIGKGAFEDLEKYREKEILVVTGPTTREVAGEEVAEELDSEITIVEEPTREEAKRVKEKMEGKELGVAVGGGKIIDVTKVGSYKAGKNFISVPTTLSNDSIASQMASLISNGTRESEVAQSPIAIFVDSKVIKNCPYNLIRGGVGDVISNLTAVKDWKLGKIVKNEYYGDYASSLSEMTGKLVKERAKQVREKTKEGIETLTEALVSSGVAMGIAGSSRPASGSEHKFSHTLDRIADKPALHGEQCAVGSIAASYLQGEDWKEIKNTLKDADLPTTAEELGIKDETAIEALTKAKEIKPNRYTVLEHVKIDRKIAENTLKATEVIE